MTLDQILNGDHFVRACLTLAHFLWQGLAIGVFVSAVNVALRRRSAASRYAVNALALSAMAACMPVTFLMLSVHGADGPRAQSTSASEAAIPADLDAAAHPTPSRSTGSRVSRDGGPFVPDTPPQAEVVSGPSFRALAAPWVVLGYCMGVLAMVARVLVAFGGGRRLRRASTPVDDPSIVDSFASQAHRLRIRVRPMLACCDRLAVPVIVGVVKPTILIPVALLTELSPCQLEAVLAHELAHIRRWDHIANLAQRLIESVLFFHPAVWYVSRRVSREREHCCDDLVLAGGTEPACYADLLVRVSELGQSQPATSPAALAAAGREPSLLRERVMRVMGSPVGAPFRIDRSVALVALAVCGLALMGVFSIDAAADRFPGLDFNNPPPAYEKGIRAADEQHRISIGSLDFQLSQLVRTEDGAIEGSLGLDDGFEVVEFRLFDHTTRTLIHDSDWELNTENEPPKFRIMRLGETDRIRIEERGGQLPGMIDLWLRLAESRSGGIVRIPAKLGSSVSVGESSIVVTSLFAGTASGKSDATGRMVWQPDTLHRKEWRTTIALQNQGAILDGRYHLVAVTKDGWRHAMDHRHFLQFAIHRGHHDYAFLDVAFDRIDHFELIPFRDRRKFFFNAVEVPLAVDIAVHSDGKMLTLGYAGKEGRAIDLARLQTVRPPFKARPDADSDWRVSLSPDDWRDWFLEHGRGDFYNDLDCGIGLTGLRGARMMPLPVDNWDDADQVTDKQLRDDLLQQAPESSVPPGFFAVLSREGRLAVGNVVRVNAQKQYEMAIELRPRVRVENANRAAATDAARPAGRTEQAADEVPMPAVDDGLQPPTVADASQIARLRRENATGSPEAAIKLIRLGAPAEPAILQILAARHLRKRSPEFRAQQHLLQAYIDHWDELPNPPSRKVVDTVSRCVYIEAIANLKDFMRLDMSRHKQFLALVSKTSRNSTATSTSDAADPVRVLLVTADDWSLLKYVLTAMNKKCRLELAHPDILRSNGYAQSKSGDTFDLIIFDSCRPAALPDTNTFFVGTLPPDTGWSRQEPVETVEIVRIDPNHPLTKYVDLRSTVITFARPISIPSDTESLISTHSGSILAVRDRGQQFDVVLAFTLSANGDDAQPHNTNWTSRPSFPAFMSNLLTLAGHRR